MLPIRIRIERCAIAGILFLSLGAQAAGRNDSGRARTPNGERIKIMSYNVENLFDADHDEGKDDWEFTPLSNPGKARGCSSNSSDSRRSRCASTDWTDAKINIKLNQIKRVVESTSRPDVIGVSEVENFKILKRLGTVMNYQGVILEEGPDRRGIDVGLLYDETKLTYFNHEAYAALESNDSTKTRDVLGAYFRFKADRTQTEVLAVYVNHWPSQANPAMKRIQVATTLKGVIDRDTQRYGSKLRAVVLGDFNTVPDDYPHPIRAVISNPNWANALTDVRELAESKRLLNSRLPLGSYFYAREMAWQFLDRFFVSKNLTGTTGISADLKSFAVVSPAFATEKYEYRSQSSPLFGSVVTGSPIRYNHDATTADKAGFSDHFPITFEIQVPRN